MDINKELEKDIEIIFLKNNERFTNELKTNYWDWKKLNNGQKIIKEVNEKIKEYKEKAKKNTKKDTYKIGEIEINGSIVPISINISIIEQIATVNDKYFSLYEKSFENTDKKIINPKITSVVVEGEIKYINKDVTTINGKYVYSFQIEEKIKEMEGYPEEEIELMGKYFTKEELETLLKECEDENIYEEYYDTEIWNIKTLITSLKNKEIILDKDINEDSLLIKLIELEEFETNTRYKTKEQEDFLKKYKKEFEEYKEAKLKENPNINIHDMEGNFIIEKNKKLSNKDKVYITPMIRPGMEFIEEFDEKQEAKLNKIKSFLKNLNKEKAKKQKTNKGKIKQI